MATKTRDKMDPAVVGMPIETILKKYVARFGERKPDWHAFADAAIDGWRRAQHRFIGNTSGKPDENFIPAGSFTLSIMAVPPGQGNAAHTHEVEEVFFVLQGILTVFLQDENGRRIDRKLGQWECVACPPGVVHGFQNDGLEPVYMQVMLGRGRPEAMGYADDDLYHRRDAHLR